MKDLFIPTAKNSYRAYLLRTPFLVLFMVIIYLFNSLAGIIPISKVDAQISVDSLLQLHNAERAKLGLSALRLNTTLSNSAQQKAAAMLTSDCWSHYCPPGVSPWEFFSKSGYSYIYAGENLAEGFFDTQAAMTAWMNSPTHRENILRGEFQDIGFGVVQGTFQGVQNNIVIAVHFGTPQPRVTQTPPPAVAAPQPRPQPQPVAQQPLPTPSIDSPRNGETLGTNSLNISGTSPDADLVKLFKNGEEWVTADANQGIFTYRAEALPDDNYQLNAVSILGNRQSGTSSAVSFVVDTTPDQISPEQITVINEADGTLTTQINSPKLSQLEAKFNDSLIKFDPVAETIWQADIPLEYLNTTSFTISNRDSAGNLWEGTLDSTVITNQLETIPQFNNLPTSQSGGQTQGLFFSKASVNMGFILFLGMLFGLDWAILSRSGLTHRAGKTHLHFAVFVIIAIIAIAGTIVGSVGTGTSSF